MSGSTDIASFIDTYPKLERIPMDGVHEMAAQLFVRIMTDRQARGMHTVDDAHEAARDSYMYAKAFFEEHGRHLSAAPRMRSLVSDPCGRAISGTMLCCEGAAKLWPSSQRCAPDSQIFGGRRDVADQFSQPVHGGGMLGRRR